MAPEHCYLFIPAGLTALAVVIAWVSIRSKPGSGDLLEARRAESPLAHLLPYWSFLDDGPAGVAINVDLTYSSVLELHGIDTDCKDQETLNHINLSLHGLVQNLPAGAVLQFNAWSDGDVTETVARYRAQAGKASPLGKMLLEAKASELLSAGAGLRRSRLLLTISIPSASQPAAARAMGFVRRFPALAQADHESHVRQLATLRDQVARSLQTAGIRARAVSAREIRHVTYEYLNPTRAQILPNPFENPGFDAPSLWSEEQSAREQIIFSGLEEDRDYLRLDGHRIRVLTLKSLPTWTEPALLEALLVELPFHVRIALAIEAVDSDKAIGDLKRRLGQATMLANLRQKRNQEAEAQAGDIDQLIDENLRSTLRMVKVSLSVVLSVDSRTQDADLVLERQTAEVLRVLGKLHGAQGLVAEYAQLDEFLATLPGNAKHGRRFRQCTSRNAAHMLPAWQPWSGTASPALLLANGRGNLVGLDPFDPALGNPNAFMAGSSGSGKSVTANYLLLNLLATGCKAIIVDEGGSYRRLVDLFGGQYFAITRDGVGGGGQASLNPFFKHAEIYGQGVDEELRMRRQQFLLAVIERMVHEDGRPLSNPERSVLTAAIEETYRRLDGWTPILSDLLAALQEFQGDDAEDVRLAHGLARQLRIWVTGPNSRLVNRSSSIELTSGFAAFDLKGLDGDPHLQAVVMLILSGILFNLVTRDRNERKIVVFDEAWRHLASESSARLIADLYRTSRKYACSILTISQAVDDFLDSPIAPALTQNSHTVYLLRHQLGHEAVAKAFHLNPRELHIFQSLEMRRGEFAEALVLHGEHHFMARVVLSPLEYWIATTHAPDLALEERVRRANPGLTRLQLLQLLAERHPRGADGRPDCVSEAA